MCRVIATNMINTPLMAFTLFFPLCRLCCAMNAAVDFVTPCKHQLVSAISAEILTQWTIVIFLWVPGIVLAFNSYIFLPTFFTGALLSTDHSYCWFCIFRCFEILLENDFRRFNPFWETFHPRPELPLRESLNPSCFSLFRPFFQFILYFLYCCNNCLHLTHLCFLSPPVDVLILMDPNSSLLQVFNPT